MMTFKHLADLFLERHQMSAATRKTYGQKLERIMNEVGRRRDVESFTEATFELARQTMETQRSHRLGGHRRVFRPYSPFSIDSTFRAVRAMFNWAAREGVIKNNPMKKFKFRKLPPVKPKAISEENFKALVAAADQPERKYCLPWVAVRNVAMLYVLRDTGARCGGLVGATVDDLDLRRGRLLVTEKGNKTRYVYLTPVTTEKVKAWLVERRKLLGRGADGALFVSSDGFGHMRSHAVGQILESIAKRAGIRGKFNPHSFRHAFARDLLRAGADLSRVSQLMGHAGVQVTADYYARWADSELQAAHAQFSPLATRDE